ncbi:AAA domain-containing protein [Tenacibaculum finnmarkense]|nr:AAA domain-containing protein [Tenacibaculum finnmarkense]
MLIIGMRAVLNFKEENETSFIGVIVNNDFIDKLPKINSDLHAFGGSDNKSLLTLNYTLFLEYKNEIIAHIQAVILEELKAIKGHSKEFWNTTSTTTSVSFKHIVNENVLLETYFNKKEIIFKNIKELVDLVNIELGGFCEVFQRTRKKLLSKKRINSAKSLFILNDETRDWSINEGGGTELQYHLFLRNNKIGYGIGFNTQYVPFANDYSPIEYMQPFINSYLAQKDVQETLSNNNFNFIEGSKEQLKNIENNQYILIGKEFSLSEEENNYTLHQTSFHQLIFDIKNVLFQSYQQIISSKENFTNSIQSFKEIPAVLKDKIDVLHHKKQIILQGPPGTGKTRLAKQIASEMTISENNFKVIQFHPSYTYEDFVRGISVKNNQDGNIEYKTENKILAKIAKEALKNYTDSQKETESLSKEVNLKEYFTLFVDFIEDKIEENNGFFKLTDNVGLLSSDEDAFRYKGKNDGWTKNGNRMLFKDILQAFTDENTVRQDLKKNPNLSGLAKQHASYFVRILNMFQEFFKDEKLTFENTSVEKVALKNYVLIIDEINRANLSSVLGELIYALEYRGEAVESMYDIDGNRKITLPPNLYIIGTMNTADRSVGQIDYAIRRRFAFIDVLPEILEESTLENDLKFNTDSFNEVEALFVGDNNHLSDEFKAKDVQLGHSYFIYKEANFDMNLKYEIKPILQEYVADGILKESALELIEALKSHL